MSTRDTTIRFLLEVLGNENIVGMAKAIKDAGAAGADAEPEIAALVAELNTLADRDRAISGFVSLKAELAEVEVQLGTAKNGLDNLTASFDRNDTSNKRVAASFALADKTIAELTARQAQLSLELQKTSGALDKAGVDTNALVDAQARLRAEAAATAERLRLVASASEASAAAEEKEAVSVKELGEKYAAFGRVLETLKDLAITIGGLFAFEKAKEEIGEILSTGDKFQRWGVQFATAFGGAEQGAEALEKVKELAEHVPISLDDLVQAALKAKRSGLDPLDGTLQTLIDTNTKYGGSIDTLNGLIDDFSKANAKGELSEKLLVKMQQDGVPAAQLLGAAMGKTADQILDMAKKGELGRDSIGLLLKALAESSKGDASKSMNLLSVQVTKLKDDWDEFLKLIADSGAYDFARDELHEIGEALKKGLGDGSLKEKAQAISDAIVGIGKAAIGTIQFLHDHAGAIKSVAEGYALVRATQLAVDLVNLAVKWKASAVAALEDAAASQKNALAKLELTAAMKASLAAAEAETVATGANAAAHAAAAEGGIAKAIGSFGSLGNAAKGVGGILASVAGGPVAATAVAAAVLTPILEKLVDVYFEWSEKAKQASQFDAESARIHNELIERLKQRIAATKDVADTQIRASKDVVALTEKERDEYAKSLQSAIRYYSELRTVAKSEGKQTEVDEYNKQLKELIEALKGATTGFDELEKKVKEGASQATKQYEQSLTTLVNQIRDFKNEGVAAPIAVQGAFEKLQIETPTGLRTILDLFGRVESQSRDVGEAVQSELVARLQKLNDLQFEQFKGNLQKALKEGKVDADSLKSALDAVAQVDFLKLGLSAEQAGVKITQAGSKIIGAFADIAKNANFTGDQIQLSFAKALSQATTEGEVDALKDSLQSAFSAGRIGAEQFGVAMEAAARKTTTIQVEAAKASAGLDGVGKAGETAAQRTTAALDEMRGKLVAQAAIIQEQIDEFGRQQKEAPAALRAQYKALEDQIKGLTDSLDAASNAGASSGNKIAAGLTNAAGAAQQNATAQKQSSDAMQEEVGIAGKLAEAMAATRAEFAAVSDTAAHAFDGAFQGALKMQGILPQVASGTNDVTSNLERLRIAAESDVVGLDKWYYALAKAQAETTAKINEQRDALNSQAAAFERVGAQGTESQKQLLAEGGLTLDQLKAMDAAIKNGTYDAGLLGKQDLATLQNALQGAIQRTEALTNATKAANDAFQSMARSAKDALLQEQGNQDALEQERHDKQLQDLADAAKAAGKLNSDAYNKAVQDENQLHDLKMKHIADQAIAQQKAQSQSSAPAPAQGPVPGPASTGISNSAALPGGVYRVSIDLNFNTAIDPTMRDQIIQQVVLGLQNWKARA